MSQKWTQRLRDLFLGGLALFILWTQLPLDGHKEAQPILIFLVIFLFGCIPALRGDNKQEGGYSPFVKIIMAILGVKLPENFKGAEEAESEDLELQSHPQESDNLQESIPGQPRGSMPAPSSGSSSSLSKQSSND